MARTTKGQVGVRESAKTLEKIEHSSFKQAVKQNADLLVFDLMPGSMVAPGAYLTTNGELLRIRPTAYAGDGADGDWNERGFELISKRTVEVIRVSDNPDIPAQDARQIASKASLNAQF